jgi:hypothetical protein
MRSRSRSLLVRAFPFATLAVTVFATVACAGTAQNEVVATPKPTPSTSASQTPETPKPPPEIPVVAPQVSATPSFCSELVAAAKPAAAEPAKPAEAAAKDGKTTKDPKAAKGKDVKPTGPCADGKSVLATLATAARAEATHDRVGRDAALASLASCDRFPTLVGDTLRAELAPMVCAEAIVTPAIEAHGKEALPHHLVDARALIGASRLARLRPKKGEFDLLARAEKDPAAAQAGKKLLLLWRDAIEKEEGDAIALASGTRNAEIQTIVRFEIADAWLAFAKEIRATPLPDEIKELSKKDPDLEVRYYGKLDEVTMPIVERAKQIALAGLGFAVRDGILVKSLASYQPVLEAFRSRVGFEVRATRVLDLQIPDALAGKPSDAVVVAATLPPWLTFAALERADPASLLGAPVLEALAGQRGIPSDLRREVEKDKNLDDGRRGAIVLSRTRAALEYESVPDAQAVAAWATPKRPIDQLRVGVAKALLGPQAPTPKPGDPLATAPQSAYELKFLDGLAKGQGPIALAADFDAALLSLDGAQRFAQAEAGPGTADPKAAYEAAIKRLDAFEKRKGADPKRAAKAKELANGARETLKLFAKAPAPATTAPSSAATPAPKTP